MTSAVRPAGRLHVVRQALNSGPMRRALTAYLLFFTAELGTWVALLVWAYGRGGAKAAGTIALIQLVPATLLAPFGAVLGDRMARNRALSLGYFLQAVAMGATGLALLADAPFGLVAACAATAATAVTLTRPVHHAIIPDIAATPEELTAGNAASGTIEGIGGFVGPALSGVVMAVWGPGQVFLIMTVFLIVAAVMTFGLAVAPMVVRVADEGAVTTAVAGFREVSHDPGAAMLVVIVGAQSVIMGLMDILVVVLALDILGTDAAGPGWLTSSIGVGVMLGGAATVILVGRRRLAPALAVGILATGIPIALLGWAGSAAGAAVLLMICGAGQAFTNVSGRTLLQRSVPTDVLARIFGIQEGLMQAGLALGSVAAPVLVAVFGAQGAFVAAGVFLPVTGMLAWVQIRRLDSRSEVPVADLALLGRIHVFAVLPAPAVEEVARAMVDVSAGPGDVVIREGDFGDRFYVVRSGELSVSQADNHIRTLAAGDSFGEIALLRDIPRTATVTAITATVLAAVSRADFLAAVTGTPRALLVANSVVDGTLDSDEQPPGPSGG